MASAIDPFILEYAPGPVVELASSTRGLRGSLRSSVDSLASIADDRLTSLWMWDGNPVDVRYGFYRALEMIEQAGSAVGRQLAALPSTEARDAVGATTAARWDLDGLLANLSDDDFDADPGGGEWTIRTTVGHIIGGQRGYAWGSAWWLSVRDQPRAAGAQRAPDELFVDMPSDEDEARGTLREVRDRLHDVVDATSSRYATLSARDLQVMAGWSGIPVTIGFRMWRWPSHIEEHTVQVEKTLDLLGRRQTEVSRLVRLISRAYGRLEQLVIGHDADRLETVGVADRLDAVARELDGLAAQVRAAADAAGPAPDW